MNKKKNSKKGGGLFSCKSEVCQALNEHGVNSNYKKGYEHCTRQPSYQTRVPSLSSISSSLPSLPSPPKLSSLKSGISDAKNIYNKIRHQNKLIKNITHELYYDMLPDVKQEKEIVDKLIKIADFFEKKVDNDDIISDINEILENIKCENDCDDDNKIILEISQVNTYNEKYVTYYKELPWWWDRQTLQEPSYKYINVNEKKIYLLKLKKKEEGKESFISLQGYDVKNADNTISILDIRNYNRYTHSDLKIYETTIKISEDPLDDYEKRIHFKEKEIYRIDISTLDKLEKLLINLENLLDKHKKNSTIGGKKHSKKDILGKSRCIYKIKGDRKEYVKHKGKLITVKEYKSIIKTKGSKPKTT